MLNGDLGQCRVQPMCGTYPPNGWLGFCQIFADEGAEPVSLAKRTRDRTRGKVFVRLGGSDLHDIVIGRYSAIMADEGFVGLRIPCISPK